MKRADIAGLPLQGPISFAVFAMRGSWASNI